MDDSFDRTVEQLVTLAREEDVGRGDLTTSLMEHADRQATFTLLARQSCVLAGQRITPTILRTYDPAIELTWMVDAADGARLTFDSEPRTTPHHGSNRPSAALATLSGPLGSILTVERVLLNFLQRLCGIATLTRRFVEAVAGTRAVICDTRKTTPGWRWLEKYAVRCGGGTNHRTGLYDGVLIKDNHLSGVPTRRLAAVVFDMLNRMPPDVVRGQDSSPWIEVEADSLEQVEVLLSVVGIDAILLDNFTVEAMRQAVALREELGLSGKVLFEASGGITLDTVRRVAETGVDRISVGALTHSAPAVDLSLERCA